MQSRAFVVISAIILSIADSRKGKGEHSLYR